MKKVFNVLAKLFSVGRVIAIVLIALFSGMFFLIFYSHYLMTKPIPRQACVTATKECELEKDWSA